MGEVEAGLGGELRGLSAVDDGRGTVIGSAGIE
jgi:hypothetical protein